MLNEIDKDMDKFYFGKHQERKIVFLSMLSCMTQKPVHTILTGVSSVGKSEMLKTCSRYLPKDCYNEFTRISPTALNRYMSEDKDFTWNHKILSITELSGAEQASDVLRVLMSEGQSRALITEKMKSGETVVIDYQINGTPTLITTTANEKIEHQFANRCLLIEISFEKSELQKIVRFIAECNTSSKKIEPSSAILKLVQKLKPFNVEIPYAKQIGEFWTANFPRSTRDIVNFFGLIRAHTVLNQENRKVVNKTLIAEKDDYEVCRTFFTTLNRNSFVGSLTYKDRNYLNAITEIAEHTTYTKIDKNGKENKLNGATIEDVMETVGVSSPTAFKYLGDMVDKGLLIQHKRFSGRERQPFVYTLAFNSISNQLPTYDKLLEGNK
jgi:hypothetical protein